MKKYITSVENEGDYGEIVAESLQEALSIAFDEFDVECYHTTHTMWVDLRVRNAENPDDTDSMVVEVEPNVPRVIVYDSESEFMIPCAHEDWTHTGIASGPNGGTTSHEQCSCGLRREIESHAQDCHGRMQGERISYLGKE